MKNTIRSFLFLAASILLCSCFDDGKVVLVTNMDGWDAEQVELQQIKGPKAVFDLSVVAYSRTLADKLAIKDNVEDDFPDGMQAAELEVKTLGKKLQCRYKFLMDSSLDVDFPEGRLFLESRGVRIYPLKVDDSPVAREWRQKSLNDFLSYNHYVQNIFLASSNYGLNKPPYYKGAYDLNYYQKDFWPGLSLYIIDPIVCSEAEIDNLKIQPSLWLKKSSGADYAKVVRERREDFLVFSFPEGFIDRSMQAFERIDRFAGDDR